MDEKGNTMNIYDELENLKVRARSNPELAQALLATRNEKSGFRILSYCTGAWMHLFAMGSGLCRWILTQQCVAPRMDKAARIAAVAGEDDLYEMFLIELM